MPTRLVVADTGPLNYLVLIEAIDVLPRLFEQILVPAAVYDELAHADAPAPVRALYRAKAGLARGATQSRWQRRRCDRLDLGRGRAGRDRACHGNRGRSDPHGRSRGRSCRLSAWLE